MSAVAIPALFFAGLLSFSRAILLYLDLAMPSRPAACIGLMIVVLASVFFGVFLGPVLPSFYVVIIAYSSVCVIVSAVGFHRAGYGPVAVVLAMLVAFCALPVATLASRYIAFTI